MSGGRRDDGGAAADLDRGRREAQLSMDDLWWAYFALGGNATPTEVRAILTGDSRPGRLDHDMLAQAINDRFVDMGGDHPVAYAPRPSDGPGTA